jgi:hypothetical protein
MGVPVTDVDTDYYSALRDTGNAEIAQGFRWRVPGRMPLVVQVCDR